MPYAYIRKWLFKHSGKYQEVYVIKLNKIYLVNRRIGIMQVIILFDTY